MSQSPLIPSPIFPSDLRSLSPVPRPLLGPSRGDAAAASVSCSNDFLGENRESLQAASWFSGSAKPGGGSTPFLAAFWCRSFCVEACFRSFCVEGCVVLIGETGLVQMFDAAVGSRDREVGAGVNLAFL